jgi:hypothetical protein
LAAGYFCPEAASAPIKCRASASCPAGERWQDLPQIHGRSGGVAAVLSRVTAVVVAARRTRYPPPPLYRRSVTHSTAGAQREVVWVPLLIALLLLIALARHLMGADAASGQK